MELGLDTFGDVTLGPDGGPRAHAQVLRDVIAEAEIADAVGVDFFGVGEHHRPDFAISAPEVILAAIAGRTKRMKLGSAVTVLSSDDPIRVFERFSTLDAASHGRAEVILGRGSFTESFPLFGLDLDQYETLFEEKLDLLAAVLANDGRAEPFSWSGTTRAPVVAQRVFPPTESGRLNVWVGVGGSQRSVVRAAHYGLPLILAIIGGDSRRFTPFVDLYRHSLARFDKPVLPIGAHSPGHVADTDDEAREQFWPAYRVMRDRIGAERGWPPTTRSEYDDEVAYGSLYVGSPETVARRIVTTIRVLGLSRFGMKYSAGTLAHDLMLRSIELYGTRVIPRVRELLGAFPSEPASA